MRDSTLQYLMSKVAPDAVRANIAPTDSMKENDKVIEFYTKPPTSAKTRKILRRFREGPALLETDEKEALDDIEAVPPFGEHPKMDEPWDAAAEMAVESRVLPHTDYSWYAWAGDKSKSITSTNGKKTAKLTKGYRFGIRQAKSSKNKLRMVTEEYGPTHVFSLDPATADLLKKHSKVARAIKMKTRAALDGSVIETTIGEVRIVETASATSTHYPVEAAPKKYTNITYTLVNLFRKAGVPIENRDPITITKAPRNAGLLIRITTSHTDITFKKIMTIRAYLTHRFKAVDFSIAPDAISGKLSLTYSVVIKAIKKDKEGKEKLLSPAAKPVKETKPEKKKTKKAKHVTPLPGPKKFSAKHLKRQMEARSSLDRAYARVEAYANQQFGRFDAAS